MRLPSTAALLAMLALATELGACHGMSRGGEAPRDAMAPPPAGAEAAGKAHLHVYLGETRGQTLTLSNGHESDFYINGMDMGPVGPSDVLYVDLDPGVYDFSWRAHRDFLGAVESSHDYDVLQPDQNVFLALNIDRGFGSLFPPLGWWLDPDTGHIGGATEGRGQRDIEGRRVIHPDAAILAKLRPIASATTYLPASW